MTTPVQTFIHSAAAWLRMDCLFKGGAKPATLHAIVTTAEALIATGETTTAETEALRAVILEVTPHIQGATAGSYYESAKGKRVTYARAIKELTRHGLPLDGEDRKEFDLFFKQHAVQGSCLCHTITATSLLDWLGY